MKKDSTLRKMIGLTQREMAELLNVSRVHYAMFEIGRRDLPLASKELLAEMLTFLQDAQASGKLQPSKEEIQEAEEQAAKELLLENQRKIYILEKKIATATRKQDAAIQKIQTLEYLKHSKGNKAGFSAIVHNAKLSKAKRDDEEASLLLFEYKIKMKVLNSSKEFLQSKT